MRECRSDAGGTRSRFRLHHATPARLGQIRPKHAPANRKTLKTSSAPSFRITDSATLRGIKIEQNWLLKSKLDSG